MPNRAGTAGPMLVSFLLILVAAVGGAGSVAAETGISATTDTERVTTLDTCRTIDEPGHYRLAGDITAGNATHCIQIVADGVVFDGGGYQVESGEARTQTGVLVRNASGVTVRNVSVVGMVWGIALKETENATVRGARANGNLRSGIWVLESENATVRNVTARRNAFDGVRFHSTRNGLVTASTLAANGVGVSVGRSRAIAVRDVTLANNQLGAQMMTTRDSEVVNNRLIDNRIGVVLAVADENRIADNRISGGEDGIMLDGADSNTVTANRISGVEFGIYLDDSTENRIEGNDVTATEVGIELTFNSDDNSASDNALAADRVGVEVTLSAGNTVQRNRIRAPASVNVAGDGQNTVSENRFERTESPTPTTPTAESNAPARTTTDATDLASPGFGPVVAVVALLLVALVVRRSRE